MSEVLSNDLTDQINKHLPGMVGDALKKRLELADKQDRDLSLLKERLDKCDEEVRRLDEHNKRLSEENAELLALVKREDELNRKEQQLQNELLKVQLNCAEGTLNRFMALMDTVFKNPVFRETNVYSKSVPFVTPGSGYPTTFTENGSTTKTQEVG